MRRTAGCVPLALLALGLFAIPLRADSGIVAGYQIDPQRR